jgi:Rod binding domain-containing protein
MNALSSPLANARLGTIPSSARSKDTPARICEAGRQFESLLIGQILHSARESGAGWFGSPEDSASDCATDFAEQQFASVLAQAGGLGIASMVQRGLDVRAADSPGPGAAP